MGVPNPALRHVVPSAAPNAYLLFTPDNTLLHTTAARIQRTSPATGHTRTLPHEAGRSLRGLSRSLDASLLLTLDEASRVTLLRAPFARPLARLSLRFAARAASLSSCGTLAAFAGDRRLQVWRVPRDATPAFAPWAPAADLTLPSPASAAATALAWSRDSRRVAVGLASGSAVVFTLEARRPGVRIRPLVLHGHRAPVVLVRFVARRGLVSLSTDGVLLCWRLRENDLLDGYEPRQLEVHDEGRNPNRRLFLVPLSARLASRHFVKRAAARKLQSADVAAPYLVVGLSNGVIALFELPDVVVNEDDEFDDGLFFITELRARRNKREAGVEEPGNAEARRRDGEERMEENEVLDKLPPEVPFSELTLLHTLSACSGGVSRVAFNDAANWVALVSAQSAQLVVWDWRAESHVLKQQMHTLGVRVAAFSPDGRALATGAADGRVKLFSVATGCCVATFVEHDAEVTGIQFAANDVIVTAARDGTVRAFDIRRYRNFRVMVGPPPRRQFGCVAADEPGELIAAGCVDTFEIVVWSLRTGQVLELLNGHQGPVSGVAFRPRRGTLASSSWDKTIRLWDMYERKGSCEVLEHSKEVLDVAFRPDGQELAGCTMAGEVVLWDADGASVVGTVDGARDAGAGRLRDSRTVARRKGHFQTMCYSSDGRFILAGAASKHMCIYHVSEGSRPALVNKVAVTRNQNFDGLLNQLNSKNLTDSGHAAQLVDDDDEEAEDLDDARTAQHKSLPGAKSEEHLRRKMQLKTEVLCVDACRTGKLWSAVTSEGALIYGDADAEEFGDAVFDPTNLDVDITPEAAREATNEGEFLTALTIALRLNERDSLNFVVEKIPLDRVSLIVDAVPVVYFTRIIVLFAWRLDHTPHLQFNLRWAKCLLMVQGSRAHASVTDPASVNTALRALNRATAQHSKRITPVADQNENMLRYLLCTAEQVA